MDGAPPFMQAYMKEAYTIVSHLVYFLLLLLLTREKLQQIGSLTRMLAAVRRAYLDVHARAPPVTRQTVRDLDTSGVDAWVDIKYFTNAERDQIDVQSRQILARCAERVHDMETLEKRASLTPHLSLSRIAKLGRTQIGQSASLNLRTPYTAFFLPSSYPMMLWPHPTLYPLTVRGSFGTSPDASRR